LAVIQTTTTTATTTANRSGTQLVVTSQANTFNIGNLVTDVSVQPYIAPQIISFYAYNMRPNKQVHIFFDSVLVDQYCSPGIIPALASTGTGNSSVNFDTSTYTTVQQTATWGSVITTDSQGHVAGQFAIPATTFKTGDRVLEIADVTNLAQGNDAITTQATAIFTASNLSVTKQATTLTTVNPIISSMPVTNSVFISASNTVSNTVLVPDVVNIDSQWEPIAQGLTINTPNNEAGVFATSITLFFKQKSQILTNGVTVYLCETNNGYPDGSKVIPFSTVHLRYADIAVSADSSVGTTFTFEAPVFLNNSNEYAFIVKPDNNDPDYWVYSANLGDTDLQSGIQVFSQPIIGTAFYGATTTQWTALQTEYIKFTLNIANFSAGSGEVYFNNSNNEYLSVSNVQYNNTSVSILPGDFVYQSTNSFANATNTTVNTSIVGTLHYYDSVKNIVYVSNSSGNYTANSFIQIHRFANSSSTTSNNSTLIATANTGSFYNPVVDAFVPELAVITPAGTKIALDYKGISNTFANDSSSSSVVLGSETEFFDKERIIASNSTEVTDNLKSANVHVALRSDSVLLSPLIDTVRAHALVIGNKVDSVSNIYNEYYNYGTSKSKYVSQVVTLAPGQDAQDLQVTVVGHRPTGTDIKVYVKFLNSEDSDSISNKTWTPMLNQGYNIFSDPSNPGDFSEFLYSTYPYYGMMSTNGTITVANTSNSITGTGTQFGTDVQVGYWINMMANSTFNETSRQVTAITNTTSLQINSPFNGNYTANAYFVVPPPTTAWLSSNTITQLANSSGSFANSLGAVATVTANTTSNIITGANTNFTSLLPGQILNIGGYNQAIVSIANATQLTVGTPWAANFTGANGYIIGKNGLTYLNNNNNLYTTFKRFQIKVILQSNDSSKVPILQDLTALALQL